MNTWAIMVRPDNHPVWILYRCVEIVSVTANGIRFYSVNGYVTIPAHTVAFRVKDCSFRELNSLSREEREKQSGRLLDDLRDLIGQSSPLKSPDLKDPRINALYGVGIDWHTS